MSRGLRMLGGLLLLLLLWPLGHAAWVSFSPGALLEPPMGRWSLRWYRQFIADPQWTDALARSLEVAALSVGFSLLGGSGLAVAVARHHFHGRRLLAGAVLLPLFIPTVVLALGLLPFVQATRLYGTEVGLALAHAVISMPAVFLIVRSALAALSPDLELAARGLGAGPARTFVRVTLPLIRPAVLAGAAVSFLLSLNEITLALFLGTPETETLPRLIWPKLRYTLSPLVAAASCVSVAVTLLGLALAVGARRLNHLVGRLRAKAD